MVVILVFDSIIELQVLLNGQAVVEHVVLQTQTDVFANFIDVFWISQTHNLDTPTVGR